MQNSHFNERLLLLYVYIIIIILLLSSLGEDRWLCTLILQQGYRVEYCAASDALTYAPEQFNEFYNQRRRWGPSTLANTIDLLSDSGNTVMVSLFFLKWFFQSHSGYLLWLMLYLCPIFYFFWLKSVGKYFFSWLIDSIQLLPKLIA